MSLSRVSPDRISLVLRLVQQGVSPGGSAGATMPKASGSDRQRSSTRCHGCFDTVTHKTQSLRPYRIVSCAAACIVWRSGEMGRRHSRRQVRPHTKKSPPRANRGEQMGAPRKREPNEASEDASWRSRLGIGTGSARRHTRCRPTPPTSCSRPRLLVRRCLNWCFWRAVTGYVHDCVSGGALIGASGG